MGHVSDSSGNAGACGADSGDGQGKGRANERGQMTTEMTSVNRNSSYFLLRAVRNAVGHYVMSDNLSDNC
jgi:hypothetical protein